MSTEYRTLKDFTSEAKERIRKYVFSNTDVPTVELAKDLYLTKQSVAALKAWDTMRSYDNIEI
jgi:hypothetical protein